MKNHDSGRLIAWLLTVLLAGLCLPGLALASDPDTAGMQRMFDALDEALATGDASSFQVHWHEQGYAENLVGGSGLSGERAFEQGHRKGWFLQPDFETLTGVTRGAPWVVRAEVVQREDGRVSDAVWVVLVYLDDEHRPRVLGAGEDKQQVLALAQRWVDGDGKDLTSPADE